jgi:hypothetical protein
MGVLEVLRKIEPDFLAKRRKRVASIEAALTGDERRKLELAVEDMIAVAEVQGTRGFQVLMGLLAADKVEGVQELLDMEVHRFSGKRGIELRGKVKEMDAIGRLADQVIERGAQAQARLHEDRRLRAAAAKDATETFRV